MFNLMRCINYLPCVSNIRKSTPVDLSDDSTLTDIKADGGLKEIAASDGGWCARRCSRTSKPHRSKHRLPKVLQQLCHEHKCVLCSLKKSDQDERPFSPTPMKTLLRALGLAPQPPSLTPMMILQQELEPQYPSLFLPVKRDNDLPQRVGDFSDVFTARYSGRKVALKRLRYIPALSDARHMNCNRTLAREAFIWSQLRHPNIVPVLGLDFTISYTLPTIISPWQENGNIMRYMESMQNGPSGAQLIGWLMDITSGLDYLHQSKIVHGDLRGVNVLISDDGRAMLSDFGLSIFHAKYGGEYVRFETARWVAPELLYPPPTKKDCPTYASDIYSLACLTIEMYTRECPFSGHSDLHVERMVLRGDRPERPTNGSGQPMGDPLWRLLESCWHASASQRPSISEVVDRLKLIAVDTRSRSR